MISALEMSLSSLNLSRRAFRSEGNLKLKVAPRFMVSGLGVCGSTVVGMPAWILPLSCLQGVR